MIKQDVVGTVLVIVLLWFPLGSTAAQELEEVALVMTTKEVLAYSDVGGQWQALRLQAQERVVVSKRAERVAIVAKESRFLGFSALTNTWAVLGLTAGESVETIEARGAVRTVLTNERVLGFGTSLGNWSAEQLR